MIKIEAALREDKNEGKWLKYEKKEEGKKNNIRGKKN